MERRIKVLQNDTNFTIVHTLLMLVWQNKHDAVIDTIVKPERLGQCTLATETHHSVKTRFKHDVHAKKIFDELHHASGRN